MEYVGHRQNMETSTLLIVHLVPGILEFNKFLPQSIMLTLFESLLVWCP